MDSQYSLDLCISKYKEIDRYSKLASIFDIFTSQEYICMFVSVCMCEKIVWLLYNIYQFVSRWMQDKSSQKTVKYIA